MSVDTYTDQSGNTVVRLRVGTGGMVFRFERRRDALELLKALRRRMR